MNGGHELVEQVYAAKTDTEAADSLIRQYMGFIRAETAKYIHRAPIEGQDEELSIVLLAFYEAILGYEKTRGAFLAYASRGIRSRLIDYYRKEKKHAKVTSLHEPVQDDESDTLKIRRMKLKRVTAEALPRMKSGNMKTSLWNLGSPFRTLRITAPGRNAHFRHADRYWPRRGKIPGCWMNCSAQKSFP